MAESAELYSLSIPAILGNGGDGGVPRTMQVKEAQEGKWSAHDRGRVQSEARAPGLGLGQWVAVFRPSCPQGVNTEGRFYRKRLMVGLWQLRAL